MADEPEDFVPGPDLLVRLIPWRDCEAYRQQGWRVEDLRPWHHGDYSMMAVREAGVG